MNPPTPKLIMTKSFIQIHIESYLKNQLEHTLKARNRLSEEITKYNQLRQTMDIFEKQRDISGAEEPLESLMDIGQHHYVKVFVDGASLDTTPTTIDIGANTKIQCRGIKEGRQLVLQRLQLLEKEFREVHQRAVEIREEIKEALDEYRKVVA